MIYIETGSADVFYNFGCEYYFASEKDLGEDVFLMWRTTPTLMIGKFQNTLEEIDSPYAKEHDITVVRRLSGGGTIYTDMGGWQFSYITRSLGLEIEFDRFINPIVSSLRSLGLNAEVSGRNDITVDGKKVSGNAQFKLGGTTVHHGSLLYETDIDELVRATTPKDYKITSKSIKSVRDRVTNISEHLPSPMSSLEFREHIVNCTADGRYTISPDDDRRIRELADEHFRNDSLVYAKAPGFEIEKTVHLSGGTVVIGLTVRKGVIETAGITGDFFSSADIPDVLAGVRYTPADVRKALEPLDGKLFKVSPGELAEALFE